MDMATAQFVIKAKENSVVGGTPLDTGIDLKPGKFLTISVPPDQTWSAGAGQRTSNANGLSNPLGANFGTFAHNGFSYLFGSLVGTVDGGKTFFPVGTQLEMTVLGPGRLSLCYWDSINGDNSGSVTATVALYDGPH
jgi:hypothetical protein